MRHLFHPVQAGTRRAQHLLPHRMGSARTRERRRSALRLGSPRRPFSPEDAARGRCLVRSGFQRAGLPARFLFEISRLRQILSPACFGALSQRDDGALMLGIVAALSWELKSLTRETIAPGAWKAISPQVLAALSGIGAESADDAAALLIGQGATALISWGYAAALDKGLKAGSLVLPERVIGASGESYAVDAEWHQRLYLAAAYNVPVRIGALVQSEAVVKTAAEKRALAERTGAVR